MSFFNRRKEEIPIPRRKEKICVVALNLGMNTKPRVTIRKTITDACFHQGDDSFGVLIPSCA